MPYATLSPVHQLLITLCRRDAETCVTDSELGLLSDHAHWNALTFAAHSHRVDGVVLTTLERIVRKSPGTCGRLPGDWAEPLKLLRRQGLGWDLEQRRVLAWLAKHGSSPVVLKGSALRHSVYRESAERPVSDLDLLFPADGIPAARRILEELGYRDPNSAEANALYAEHHFHTQMEHLGGFKLELHWALTLPGPHSQIDAAAVLREARPVPQPGGSFLAPRPEHMVLHLASQSTEDSVSRLGRIVDADRVIACAAGSFDWDLLQREATEGHLQNVLGVTLRLAEQLFGTPVPARFTDRLHVSPIARANLAALRPVVWIMEQRALRFGAVRTLMKAWLETAPGARLDITLKVLRLRRDPLKLLHDAVVWDYDAPRSQPWNWIPAWIKLVAYQVVVWGRVLANVARASRAEEMDFWTARGASHERR